MTQMTEVPICGGCLGTGQKQKKPHLPPQPLRHGLWLREAWPRGVQMEFHCTSEILARRKAVDSEASATGF